MLPPKQYVEMFVDILRSFLMLTTLGCGTLTYISDIISFIWSFIQNGLRCIGFLTWYAYWCVYNTRRSMVRPCIVLGTGERRPDLSLAKLLDKTLHDGFPNSNFQQVTLPLTWGIERRIQRNTNIYPRAQEEWWHNFGWKLPKYCSPCAKQRYQKDGRVYLSLIYCVDRSCWEIEMHEALKYVAEV